MSIKLTGGSEWKKIISSLQRNGLGVKVGVLENAEASKNVAEYAFYNEFGTKRTVTTDEGETEVVNTPSRPFMRFTVKNNKSKWAEGLAKSLQGVISSKKPEQQVSKALGRFGVVAKQDIQATISKNNFDANSAITIKRKGSHKPPLIDTGDLWRSINYVVNKTI